MSGPDPVAEHGSAAPIEILPVTGLPEFRPGDDLAAAIVTAAPWLRDGDIVAITSKVVSKCEGRIVAAPADAEQRTRPAGWRRTRHCRHDLAHLQLVEDGRLSSSVQTDLLLARCL